MSTLKRMINIQRLDMIGYLKKARIFEFFQIKNVLDLNFETEVFIELLNN